MSIEVRIPTILRTYTGGEKAVEASGGTLSELISDLDVRHPGLRDRLVDEKGLRRFVNVYLNDEDVRFLGGLETPVADGDVTEEEVHVTDTVPDAPGDQTNQPTNESE